MLMVVEIRLNCERSCSKGVRNIEEDKEMKESYKKTKLTVFKALVVPALHSVHILLKPTTFTGCKHACGLTV